MNSTYLPLHDAVASGDLKAVKLLAENPLLRSKRNSRGDTVLHIAAGNDHTEVLCALLQLGISPDVRNNARETPLHLVSKLGTSASFFVLLLNHANPTLENENSESYLTIASRNGHTLLVHLLLSTTFRFDDAWKAIQYALLRWDDAVFQIFVEHKYGLEVEDPNTGDKPIHHAADVNDKRGVERALVGGAKADVVDFMGATPLHHAARRGHLEIVKSLLRFGAYPDPVDKEYGTTPLACATAANHPRLVRILLKAGADPMRIIPPGRTLLHIAAQGESTEILKLFVHHGVGVNVEDEEGGTAAKWAARRGNVESLKVLHEMGCDLLKPDQYGHTPSRFAAEKGHEGAVKFLLDIEALATPNHGESAPTNALHSAVEANSLHIINNVLSAGNFRDYLKSQSAGQLLDEQVSADRSQSMQALIHAGVPIAALRKPQQDRVLMISVERGLGDIVKIWLEACAHRDTRDGCCSLNPVHLASVQNEADILEMLIIAGFNAQAKTKDGQNALHYAACHGSLRIIARFRELFGNLNPMLEDKDTDGNIPLHWAAQEGRHQVVAVLPRWIGNVNTSNKQRETPLHLACAGGHTATIRALLDAGADPHLTDLRLKKPLHNAALSQSFEAMQAILPSALSDINAVNAAENTPLILATERGCLPIVQLLIESGANFYPTGAHGLSACEVAAATGKSNILRLFLNDRLYGREHPGVTGKLWLQACRGGNAECFEVLLSVGPPLGQVDRDTLIAMLAETALEGDDKFFSALLRNTQSRLELSQALRARLLIMASRHGCLESARLLSLPEGFHGLSFRGWTPLDAARQNGHSEVVETLLENWGEKEACWMND
jgi:ankyrin repeat protein